MSISALGDTGGLYASLVAQKAKSTKLFDGDGGVLSASGAPSPLNDAGTGSTAVTGAGSLAEAGGLSASSAVAASDVSKTDSDFQALLDDSDQSPEGVIKEITRDGYNGYMAWQIKQMKAKVTQDVMGSMNLTPEQVAAMSPGERAAIENQIMQEVQRRMREKLGHPGDKDEAGGDQDTAGTDAKSTQAQTQAQTQAEVGDGANTGGDVAIAGAADSQTTDQQTANPQGGEPGANSQASKRQDEMIAQMMNSLLSFQEVGGQRV